MHESENELSRYLYKSNQPKEEKKIANLNEEINEQKNAFQAESLSIVKKLQQLNERLDRLSEGCKQLFNEEYHDEKIGQRIKREVQNENEFQKYIEKKEKNLQLQLESIQPIETNYEKLVQDVEKLQILCEKTHAEEQQKLKMLENPSTHIIIEDRDSLKNTQRQMEKVIKGLRERMMGSISHFVEEDRLCIEDLERVIDEKIEQILCEK